MGFAIWSRPKKSKYGSTKVNFHGRSFGSKLEAAVYQMLLAREQAGEISDIKCQVNVHLTMAKILYIADFSFFDNVVLKVVYCESKGFESPEWRLKRKLWMHFGPGKLEIWKGTYKRPTLSEVITPKTINERQSFRITD